MCPSTGVSRATSYSKRCLLVIECHKLTVCIRHQKEAIGFISQREHGQALEHILWDYNDTDEDEPLWYPQLPSYSVEVGIDARYSYQHVFNGERRAEPQEASGGILADEMGLGKSLVTLSVIAGSLDEAERFAGRQEQSDVSQKKNPTQATLIVVPSTCKSCTKTMRQYIL